MRRTPVLPTLVMLTIVLSSCAPEQDRPPLPQTTTAPRHQFQPDRVTSMSGLRTQEFDSLESATAAADLVVVGVVLDSIGQLEGYPLPATESLIEIVETLKGNAPGTTLRVVDLGTSLVEMEGAAPPPAEGETYLFVLHSLDEYTSVDGIVVDASHIYTPTFPAHYLRRGDTYRLDVNELPDNLPDTVTLDDVRATID